MTRPRRLLALVGCTAIVGATAAATQGAEPAAVARVTEPAAAASPSVGGVEVRVGAVLASNASKEFDTRLAALHRQFNALFPYSSYRLVKEEHQHVQWGERVGFDIPGGRYVVVIPKEYKNERVAMKVMLLEGARPIVDTAVSLRNHGTFLVAGPREQEGVLILSIGAQTVP